MKENPPNYSIKAAIERDSDSDSRLGLVEPHGHLDVDSAMLLWYASLLSKMSKLETRQEQGDSLKISACKACSAADFSALFASAQRCPAYSWPEPIEQIQALDFATMHIDACIHHVDYVLRRWIAFEHGGPSKQFSLTIACDCWPNLLTVYTCGLQEMNRQRCALIRIVLQHAPLREISWHACENAGITHQRLSAVVDPSFQASRLLTMSVLVSDRLQCFWRNLRKSEVFSVLHFQKSLI
jgi:hypothetical protein